MKTLDRQTVATFIAENPFMPNRESARKLGIHESFIRRVKAEGASTVDAVHTPEPPKPPDEAAMLGAIRKRPMTSEEIATVGGTTRGVAIDWLDRIKAEGYNVREVSGAFAVGKDLQAAYVGGPSLEIVSSPDNRFRFGAMGDTHLGSKYERLDCLNRIYDRYQSDGITKVLHAGNWIEGEARFNVFDLLVHGMDAQCRYLAENYPQRPGMNTYAVAGDDHEGWYCQKTGVNIGEYAEGKMRKAGRNDWHDLGYMEAHIKLTNANTGKSAVLALVHPGGGSAYALSYTMQKLVESYEGGEKPAVLIMGHYHKLMAANIRNVWCIQSGCFQDQTPFMRKKRLEAHVGGVIVDLQQDPETGAIVECQPNIIRYFNRAYYSNRWSHSGPVVLPDRS